MTDIYDIAVIGAGAAGLTVTSGAAQLGLNVVLFESGEMGGDCLNVGCVPSKSLIAAAERAHAARASGAFGITAEPQIDFPRVMEHVQEVIARIAPHDSVERFEGLGATVVRARARFTGPDRLEANGTAYRAKRFVIAAGSRPATPPLPGLDKVPYLTNETLWGLRELPKHLLILGGGAIGVEMAQAFRRLGSEVTVVEMGVIMSHDDPDLVEVVRAALLSEGVTLKEGVSAEQVSSEGGDIRVALKDGSSIIGSHLLVAAGRKANVDDLGLDRAGVNVGKAIKVDARLRTSNKHIYALGDCREGPQFTHAAGYDGGIAVRNIVFRLPAKADYSALPWCTYTAPELAQVGLTEAKARETLPDVSAVTTPFSKNDRAQAELATEGLIKLVLSKGKLVGAGVVGRNAGEIIHGWSLAMSKGLGLRDISGYIAPYPTLGEISKAAAGGYLSEKLFSPMARRAVGLLAKLP